MIKEFFAAVRQAFGPLSETQVAGLNALLAASAKLSLAHRAYILATAWHETGPEDSPLHMTPRREIWGPTKAQIGYEGRADLGNTVMGDGRRFSGRGFVQITGRRNYEKASSLTGKDLVGNPDLALNSDIAAAIMVDGMSRGWFTGKKMADYANYRDMRRVVNGTDRADLIAGYAAKFEAALRSMKAPAPVPAEPPRVVIPPPPDVEPIDADSRITDNGTPPGASIAKWIIAAIGAAAAVFGYWMTKG